jgi:hypothetical protein
MLILVLCIGITLNCNCILWLLFVTFWKIGHVPAFIAYLIQLEILVAVKTGLRSHNMCAVLVVTYCIISFITLRYSTHEHIWPTMQICLHRAYFYADFSGIASLKTGHVDN